jgi:hypothetical protein
MSVVQDRAVRSDSENIKSMRKEDSLDWVSYRLRATAGNEQPVSIWSSTLIHLITFYRKPDRASRA